MKKLFAGALAALVSGLCVPVHSQSMKPGLWEVSQRMEGSDGETEAALARMQKQMAALPPAQRKIMEDTMARQGIRVGTATGGGRKLQLCVTREMAGRNDIPSQPRSSCRTIAQQRIANTMKLAFVCTEPPSRGDGQVTFTSPESYDMKMTVESTEDGKARKTSMQATGAWRGADCGSVKPPPGAATAR